MSIVYLLSYSRFRIYRLSMSKTQEVLFSFLDDAFETLGGVPNEILCDNMKTIMDQLDELIMGKVMVFYMSITTIREDYSSYGMVRYFESDRCFNDESIQKFNRGMITADEIVTFDCGLWRFG